MSDLKDLPDLPGIPPPGGGRGFTGDPLSGDPPQRQKIYRIYWGPPSRLPRVTYTSELFVILLSCGEGRGRPSTANTRQLTALEMKYC